MKKVVIAGCGHGGLSAAAAFAREGYSVTVLEKGRLSDLGYDWHDTMRRSTFEKAGLPLPPEEQMYRQGKISYYNPKKTVRLVPKGEKSVNVVYVDRKYLLNMLIANAEAQGAEIIFEAPVISAMYEGDRVTGVVYEEKGVRKTLSADLVVDACGLNSPVRMSLPDRFGIQRYLPQNDIFCVYRGYYEKTEEKFTDPHHTIFFYHCKKPGMNWAITENGYIDILVGGFGSLNHEETETALRDFHKEYPYMGEKLVRGGAFDKIPLGKTMPVMVCSGYAAVGNSAFMTEPLSGSGLDMSLYGGKILADTVISAGGDTGVTALWKYNYRYFKEIAEGFYNDLAIKSLLSSLTAEDIDFFIEEGILTEKEIAGGGRVKYSFSDIVKKINIAKKPQLLIPLSRFLIKMGTAAALKNAIPKEYSREKVELWVKAYSIF